MRTHEGSKPFWCEVPGCSKTFNEKGNLRTHMRAHSGLKPYKCVEFDCKASFKFSINLKYHLKSHQKNNLNFYCVYCPNTFTRYNTLQSHIEIHKEENSKPISQALLNTKRRRTAEELIAMIHPRQARSLKKDVKHKMKKLSMSTQAELSTISLDNVDLNYEKTSKYYRTMDEDNKEDYFDFRSNLSFLCKFTKDVLNPLGTFDSILNLKVQLGVLLQDHSARLTGFKTAALTTDHINI